MHGISVRDCIHCIVCVHMYVCLCVRACARMHMVITGFLNAVYYHICGSTGSAGVSVVDSAHVLHMHV